MNDLLAAGGVALVVVGVGAIWWPLALVTLGCIMLAIAFGLAWSNASARGQDERGQR